MENIIAYICPELLALIPALYFTGMGLKSARVVADRLIPMLLGGAGVLLALLWVLSGSEVTRPQEVLQAIFAASTQGVLCAGCAVYAHQLYKQAGKEE